MWRHMWRHSAVLPSEAEHAALLPQSEIHSNFETSWEGAKLQEFLGLGAGSTVFKSHDDANDHSELALDNLNGGGSEVWQDYFEKWECGIGAPPYCLTQNGKLEDRPTVVFGEYMEEQLSQSNPIDSLAGQWYLEYHFLSEDGNWQVVQSPVTHTVVISAASAIVFPTTELLMITYSPEGEGVQVELARVNGDSYVPGSVVFHPLQTRPSTDEVEALQSEIADFAQELLTHFTATRTSIISYTQEMEDFRNSWEDVRKESVRIYEWAENVHGIHLRIFPGGAVYTQTSGINTRVSSGAHYAPRPVTKGGTLVSSQSMGPGEYLRHLGDYYTLEYDYTDGATVFAASGLELALPWRLLTNLSSELESGVLSPTGICGSCRYYICWGSGWLANDLDFSLPPFTLSCPLSPYSLSEVYMPLICR